MVDIPTIEPFQFIRSTAFSERVQLANKLNEVIDALNQIRSIDDLQTQIDAINSEISEIQTAIEDTNSDVSTLSNQVNTLVSEVNGLLKEVVNEVVLDAPEYGQVRVKVIHEDETETASNALQIPVIVDGGISLISGTTARSFKIRYITADGVTHTTNDFVIPEGGGGTDVTVTSVTILEGDTDNSFKFEVGLSDGSEIQSNSYPFPAASELTPATTSQLGGVKIGQNVKVTVDGTISVDLSPYLLKTDAETAYQPKGDYLTEIPVGGAAIGGVKNGGNVTIAADGTMNTESSGASIKSYTDLSDFTTDFSSASTTPNGSEAMISLIMYSSYQLEDVFIKKSYHNAYVCYGTLYNISLDKYYPISSITMDSSMIRVYYFDYDTGKTPYKDLQNSDASLVTGLKIMNYN